MKRFKKLLVSVLAGIMVLSAMTITSFAADGDCSYTDGISPSYTYTVEEDAASVVADVTILLPTEGDTTWNDWCGNGVKVTNPDGTVAYYQWGGASVNWDADFDGDKESDSIAGVDGNSWLGTVADGKATLKIPAVKGSVVDFYTMCWDSYKEPIYNVVCTPSDEVVNMGGEETPTDAPTEPAGPREFDPSSKDYFAQLFVQFGGSWAYRNPYSDGTYGGSVGYANADTLVAWVDDDGDASTPTVDKPHDGAVFEDVKLEGNGSYTIKFTTETLPAGSNCINLAGISTNLPAAADGTVKFKDVKIIVNNMFGTAYTYAEGTADPDALDADYINVLGLNIWNSEICTDANNTLAGEANWPAEGVTSIEIQFTVEGFDYDKVEEVPTTEGSGEAATQAPDSSDDDTTEGGFPTWAKIAIPVAVVVVVVIIVVVASKKKKAE